MAPNTLGAAASPEAVQDNLINLKTLDEASLLHNLQARYEQDQVYTDAGPVLVSVNPLQALPLYTPEILDKYSKRDASSLGPHVFEVADRAYRAMLETGRPQAIVAAGESGSGKTEATKLMLIYLMEMSRRQGEAVDLTSRLAATAAWTPRGSGPEALCTPRELLESMEERAVCAQLILEAFGHAATGRNANASRFNKWTEVSFTGEGQLRAARVHAFCLEAARVAQRPAGQRNFHILYELLAHASRPAHKHFEDKYALGAADGFRYTAACAGEDCSRREDGTIDGDEFERVLDAMDVLHFSAGDRDGMWRVLAALLHLGNVRFEHAMVETATTKEDGCTIGNPETLAVVADLLRVPKQSLERALLFRKFAAAAPSRRAMSPSLQDMYVAYKLEESQRARDALAVALYTRLFQFVVARINRGLLPTQARSSGSPLGHEEGAAGRTIGLLDAAGFEALDGDGGSGFEQLCINYGAERMHQYFNEACFQSKVAEYAAEGVEMEGVQCNDNAAVLAALERRSGGVFSLVNDEIRTPAGTPGHLLMRMRQAAAASPSPLRATPEQAEGTFQLDHYAGSVVYEAAGMLERSRAVLHPDLEAVLAASSLSLVARMFPNQAVTAQAQAAASPATPATPTPRAPMAPTVAAQCCAQVAAMVDRMRSAAPHFVQCVRPNLARLPGTFDAAAVAPQLAAVALLPLCRLHKEGYGVRLPHAAFVQRYWPLAPGAAAAGGAASLVATLSDVGIMHPGLFTLGQSALFLKATQHKWLDIALESAQADAARTVQRHARRWRAQRWYAAMTTVRNQLRFAAARRDAEPVRRALKAAKAKLPYGGRHLAEHKEATRVLERLPIEAKLEKTVFKAIQAGDLEELRGVVETCKAEGYSSAAVDYANTFILMVRLQVELESKVQANEAYELQVRALHDKLQISEADRAQALAELAQQRRAAAAAAKGRGKENSPTDHKGRVLQMVDEFEAEAAAPLPPDAPAGAAPTAFGVRDPNVLPTTPLPAQWGAKRTRTQTAKPGAAAVQGWGADTPARCALRSPPELGASRGEHSPIPRQEAPAESSSNSPSGEAAAAAAAAVAPAPRARKVVVSILRHAAAGVAGAAMWHFASTGVAHAHKSTVTARKAAREKAESVLFASIPQSAVRLRKPRSELQLEEREPF